MPLCRPQIAHAPARDRTRVSVLRSHCTALMQLHTHTHTHTHFLSLSYFPSARSNDAPFHINIPELPPSLPEEGGFKFLRNDVTFPPDCMTSHHSTRCYILTHAQVISIMCNCMVMLPVAHVLCENKPLRHEALGAILDTS